MNYLVITDNQNLIDEINNKLNSLDKNLKINKSDFLLENIKKIKKYFDKTSVLIIHKNDNLNSDFLKTINFITGYAQALSIPIYSNIDDLLNSSFLSKNDITFYKNQNELLKKLDKDFSNHINLFNQKSAKQTLFNKGIPFTPDCCGIYIAKNKPEIYNLFLDGGIDINSKDDLGTPLLNIAVRYDNLELVNRLISMSADINCVSDDRGYTPIMDAVWRGNKEITELLIKKGADLNTINKEGQNNLVLAVGANKIEICELLAKNGANPDIKDSMGMSAYEYAKLFKKTEIIEILEKFHN